MDKNTKLGVWFFAIQIALALVLYWMGRNAANKKPEVVTPPSEPDFYAPWNYTNPGIPPDAPGFQSTVNVYIDNPLAGALSYQYMPIFGLVGFNTNGYTGV